MKNKILTVAAAIALACTVSAQTPSPSIQPAAVTPTPATGQAGGRGVDASQVTTFHYQIRVRDLQQYIGANTSGDILLFTTTPLGYTFIGSAVMSVKVTVAGGGILSATAQVKTANNNYGSAQDVFTATTNPTFISLASGTPPLEPPNTAVNLHFVVTGQNINVATQGIIDVWLNRTELRQTPQ